MSSSMVVEDCTMAESKLAQATPADFLVCGACHKNFMLSSMQDFVQHKLFDCEDISGKAMECQSCRKRFQTPWSLLQHAQKNHALNIFLEHGPYSSEIQGLTMEEATSTRTTIAKVSVGTNTEEDIFKHTARGFADLSTQSNLVHSSPSGHIVNDTAVDLAPAHITTHSVVTRSSNVATAAVSQCSMPSPTKSTSSVSVSPTSVAIVLPKLVQVSDKIRPLLSGSHAISVLQPIRLPQGTLIGAPIDPSMSRMSLSTLPVVQPVTQAKSPTVPVQTVRVSTPNITLTTANAKSPEQSKPISFTPNTNSSPRLILPQTTGQSSYMIDMEDSSTHSPRDEVQAGPTSKILESPLPLSQTPNGSQVSHVRPVLDVGKVPVVGQSPNVDHVGQLSSAPVVVQGPAIVPEPSIARKPIIYPVVSVSQTLNVNKVITVTQGESVARLSEPVHQNTPTAVAKSGLASLLTCVCPCCKVGKCCVRNLQLSGVGACGPPCPVVAETTPHKAHPTGDISAASALVFLNDAAVQADNSKCCCKPTTKSLKRKRDVETKDQEEEEENEKDEGEEASDKDAENTIQCCDNQDCGVTIMPGTHEGLKKCCNAVVPKKRKRHMETKHRVKKRAAAEASFAHPEENTIYIDYFQPSSSAARPRVSTSVAGVTLGSAGSDSCGTITVNTSSSVGTKQVNSAGRDNPSSLTLSIPVSYTRKTSCSSGNCSKQSSGDKQDCGCGCCPLLGYSNREKKLSKSGRRLSSGNGDSRRELLTNSDSKSAGQNNELKVKLESSNAAESGGEQGADHGDRIGLRKTVRTGMSNKKRRYPTSRPFKCDQCDNAFNQRIHLKKHQSKHTGIKPFKCEQCDYSTVERSHLKVHIRVHTGEKPFKCSHCEYATAQNSTLKIHLKRHHGQGGGEDGSHAPFSCTVCGLEFDDEGPYLQHLQDQPSHASSEPHASSSGSKSDSGTGQPSGEGTSREEGTQEEQDPEEDVEGEGTKRPADKDR